MKKSIFLFLIFISNVGLYAQKDYYWNKGQKIPLEVQPTKKYILFESDEDEATLPSTLGIPVSNLKTKGKITMSKTIKPFKQNAFKERRWAIIEDNGLNKSSFSANSRVLYEANFYKNSENEAAGLSHLFYVKLKNNEDVSYLEKLAYDNNVEIIGNNSFMPLWFTLSCTNKSKGDALKMANVFYESSFFAAAEPDFMIKYEINCTNDPLFNDQWNLNNTGQNGGKAGTDINFCQSRALTLGNPEIVIAVLDQGIEFGHPDLTNIFDLSFDTETGTSPSQVRGAHGTTCAGIIGASSDSIGIAGIAPNCPLMSISHSLIVEEGAPDYSQFLANGFSFAWYYGASVISNSWGHNWYMPHILDDAINNALNLGRNGLGCVIVFASGNNTPFMQYPANSTNLDILVVGGIDRCGVLSGKLSTYPNSCDPWPSSVYSNGSCFGPTLDIVAAGTNVPTTDRQGLNGYNRSTGTAGDYYLGFGGTSAACPQVAAVAGLILSINPYLTRTEVYNIIESTAQKVRQDLYTYQSTPGRLNGTWSQYTGYGLLDAFAATIAAKRSLTCNGNDINITDPINGAQRFYNVNNTITASNQITNESIVCYGASNRVSLQTGFKASSGCYFKADLKGCSISLKSASQPDKENIDIYNSQTLNSLQVEESSVNLLPNPAGSYISVNGLNEFDADIYNTSGIKVMQFSRQQGRIDISMLTPGIYIVHLKNVNYTFIRKLVKK